MSNTSQFSPTTADAVVNDIIRWRRKKLSIMVILIATATWVVLEVYEFNFVTVASWVLMAIVTSLFLWGNLCRLLAKEPPNLSEVEIREEAAVNMANTVREWIERGVRWMFRVGAESVWYVFFGTVAGLWLLSVLGNYFDLLPLLYIGILLNMTIPVIYDKYKDKIQRCGERVKLQLRRIYDMVDEKFLKKMKSSVIEVKKKAKKIE